LGPRCQITKWVRRKGKTLKKETKEIGKKNLGEENYEI